MKKAILITFILFSNTLMAESIVGLWKSINRDTGRQESVVAVYEYQGKYYGRILGTFGRDGKMDATIDNPKKRAPRVIGNPYYCGLDIIYGVRKVGKIFKGTVLDPKKGETHDVDFYVKNGNFIIRGTFLFFSGTATWVPADLSEFPKGFEMPDVKDFVPVIPRVY